MASPLSDLDELILKCRDQKAKNYIKEAVACYKAGAFRSAIVSTWIAVSFDIIDKLKELSLAGDKEAEKQIQYFEKARRTGDIGKSLKFERDILSVCKDNLELISPVEYVDLERLQQDRNRCAHPSMTEDGNSFNPSAELARMHIRAAVEHLLQYPPAQGKYALDSLLSDVDSEYFPIDLEKAVVAFENSPLKKARNSLIRNFTIVLLKKIVEKAKDYKQTNKLSNALNAIREIHRIPYSKTLKGKLSSIVRGIEPGDLDRAIPLIEKVKDSWFYLEADVKHKFESYVENLPKENFDSINLFLSNEELKAAAIKRLRKATRIELDELKSSKIPLEVSDRIVALYSKSGSFDNANFFASTIIRHARDFTKEQIERIINACGENSQIKGSFEVKRVIGALRRNEHVSDEEVDVLLLAADLKEFVEEKKRKTELEG